MFHEICKLLAGDTLALAPFKKDGTILDLGTGTGIWAIEAGMKALRMTRAVSSGRLINGDPTQATHGPTRKWYGAE